jgi:hypothetical protein
MDTTGSRQRGEERQGWHFEKTINVTVIMALLLPTLSMLAAGSWWYMNVERRFVEMSSYDERLVQRINVNEVNAQAIERRLTARLQQETTRLREDMADIKGMLTQILLQTQRPQPGASAQLQARADET